MFRYILPVILVGGQSSRMGFSKSFLYLNKLYLFEYLLFKFLDIGFLNVCFGGKFLGCFFIDDFFNYYGPLGSFYSFFYNNICVSFFHFLYISVDMPFFNISLFYYLIFRSNKNFSYVFSLSNLPILLAISNNTFFWIYFLCKSKRHSILYLLYFVSKNVFLYKYFFTVSFFNINTVLEFFLRK